MSPFDEAEELEYAIEEWKEYGDNCASGSEEPSDYFDFLFERSPSCAQYPEEGDSP